MKYIILTIVTLIASLSFSQEQDKEALLAAQKKANNYIYDANKLINEDDFVSAEMEYRKALSERASSVAGIYNLGSSYIKKGSYEEALYRLEQATKASTLKEEKHKAFHNIGNVLMQNKKCKEAVEAYKNALRNNPTDEETRYNLGLAKICADKQKDQQDKNKDDKKDQDKKDDKKDQDKKNQDKKDGDDKKDQDKKDQGDKDKKEGDDKKDDKGKPKDDKQDKGKDGDEKDKQPQQPKPQQGQMSPQQVKNLLEAMNNQEQKVQEKMNAEKQKGVKIKTDKDW
jgi:tetratricopeptide (TPR) repeat protein